MARPEADFVKVENERVVQLAHLTSYAKRSMEDRVIEVSDSSSPEAILGFLNTIDSPLAGITDRFFGIKKTVADVLIGKKRVEVHGGEEVTTKEVYIDGTIYSLQEALDRKQHLKQEGKVETPEYQWLAYTLNGAQGPFVRTRSGGWRELFGDEQFINSQTLEVTTPVLDNLRK